MKNIILSDINIAQNKEQLLLKIKEVTNFGDDGKNILGCLEKVITIFYQDKQFEKGGIYVVNNAFLTAIKEFIAHKFNENNFDSISYIFSTINDHIDILIKKNAGDKFYPFSTLSTFSYNKFTDHEFSLNDMNLYTILLVTLHGLMAHMEQLLIHQKAINNDNEQKTDLLYSKNGNPYYIQLKKILSSNNPSGQKK
ncbi:MAG TPA: hypothetical protein PLW93_03250 [Candidatus Absconditabacterales bacterium]|nr:hypothetical protein [Candidatus Absconditabacterales bacterium]HNG97266.1 hypothetical protein [Candidatus Absconditabacterales bacterium]